MDWGYLNTHTHSWWWIEAIPKPHLMPSSWLTAQCGLANWPLQWNQPHKVFWWAQYGTTFSHTHSQSVLIPLVVPLSVKFTLFRWVLCHFSYGTVSLLQCLFIRLIHAVTLMMTPTILYTAEGGLAQHYSCLHLQWKMFPLSQEKRCVHLKCQRFSST